MDADQSFDILRIVKIKQAVGALAALAQDSRLRVFRLLVRCGPEGLPAGVIAERLGIPPPTLSFHLKDLEHAGLATARRNGRSIIYSLRVEGIRALLGFLADDCCKGQPELCLPILGPTTCGVGSEGCGS
jgi:DNA-binding transcriptional ArsR family regulator